MLSNIELILLKFIKTNPSYAYEIEKIVEKQEIRTWIKLGCTTIYQVLDRMCKNGLLEFKIEKEGNMPERKRYYITAEGNEKLLQSTREILSNNEYYYFDLSVGLSCRYFLDEEEFKKMIAQRLNKLNTFIDSFEDDFEKAKALYPTKRLLIREHLLAHYKLEVDFLMKLLETGDSDEQ